MKGKNHREIAFLIMLLLVIAAAARLRADVVVYVSIDGFAPESTSIAVGEAVFWVVADDQGPYTISSFAGDWTPRYLYDEGDSVGLRFNEAGDYSYYDAFSFNGGVVHVGNAVPNLPPTGTITSPLDGAVFTAPASFTMSVDASDPDDGVMDVEFYLGDQLVDDEFNPPFTTSITNLSTGTYTLSAVVYDYSGGTVTQSVHVLIQGGSSGAVPSLATPSFVGGQLQLGLSGLTSGKMIVLQSSVDLVSSAKWTSVQTNQTSAATMVLNLPATGANRFFRVIQLP